MESGKSVTLTPEKIAFQKISSLIRNNHDDIQKALIIRGCQFFRKKMMTARTTQDKIMLLTYTRALKRIPRNILVNN